MYPEYLVRSHAEAYYQATQNLGVPYTSVHNYDITGPAYRKNKIISGMDTEEAFEAGFDMIEHTGGIFE